MAEPAGFLIKRPVETDVGEYVIFITRPSAGPFGTAGTAIFACEDDIQSKGDYFVAMTDRGPVEFSKDLPFLKVPRVLTAPVTTKEMAELQLAEKKEWDDVFEKHEEAEAGDLSAGTLAPDGRMSANPGQYL